MDWLEVSHLCQLSIISLVRLRRGGGPDWREARVRLPQLPRLQRGGQEDKHQHQHRGDDGNPHQVCVLKYKAYNFP